MRKTKDGDSASLNEQDDKAPWGPAFHRALEKQGWTLEQYLALCRKHSGHPMFRPSESLSRDERERVLDGLRSIVDRLDVALRPRAPDARDARPAERSLEELAAEYRAKPVTLSEGARG